MKNTSNIKKYIFTVLVTFPVIFTASCGYSSSIGNNTSGKHSNNLFGQETAGIISETSSPPATTPPPVETIQEKDSAGETGFDIDTSDFREGWKKITVRNYSCKTDDWNNFYDLSSGSMIKYSIHIPGTWTMDYSVIYDDSKNKVAEFFPPVTLAPGQKLLENWNPQEEEVISKENFDARNSEAIKVSSTIYLDESSDAECKAYTYYFSDGTHACALRFYRKKPTPQDLKLFDDIASTFEFIQD